MRWWKVILLMMSMMLCLGVPAQAGNEASSAEIDVADILFGHTSDGYGWHVTTWKGHHVTIPLP